MATPWIVGILATFTPRADAEAAPMFHGGWKPPLRSLRRVVPVSMVATAWITGILPTLVP